MKRSVVLVCAIALGATPVVVRAAKVSVPGAPTIASVTSVKRTPNLFDLKVAFTPPSTNGGSPVVSTVVTAGGRSCTASRSSRTCTIARLKKGSRVSVIAKSRNSRGFGKPSRPVSYLVGSKPWVKPSSTPTTTTATTTVAPGTRPYEVVVPSSYSASSPAPLVIMLHGYGATGSFMSDYLGLGALAQQRGFLLVHPDGTTDALGRQFWNATDVCCDFTGSKVDDEGYLLSIIDNVSSEYSVDQKRVFFIGHSNGGFMSYRMACNNSSRIAAIAVLAGAMVNDASKCTPSNPVSVLHVHGTADETISYGGGDIFGNTYPGAETSISRWVQSNQCGSTPSTSPASLDLVEPSGNDTTVKAWSSCTSGAATVLWTTTGGVHTPEVRPDFTARIIDFLLAHPKP